MTTRRILWFLAALALQAPLTAQVPQLTVERIFGSSDFASDLVSVQWMRDGSHYTTTEPDPAGGTNLYRVEATTGKRELLVRGSDLRPLGASRPIGIERYAFSQDEAKLLIFTNSIRVWRQNTKGTYYVWDFAARKLIPVSTKPGYQMFAKFSPDGDRIAFVREHNIFLTDLATGAERPLTSDGNENVINGTTDWVYEEELDLRDAFRWSPDGQRIAFWRLDQSAIKPFYMIDVTKLYPELLPVRYPKAGSQNSEVRIGVLEIETGKTTWIDLGTEKDIYIARMDFTGPDQIWLERLNRHQNRLELMLADVASGRSRVIMTDTDPAWVNVQTPLWIDDGKRFLYLSERDGYQQIFLFRRDGSLERNLTAGAWDVLSVHGVDERRKVVYFTAAAEGPLTRPLYRVGLNGRGLRSITSRPGTHNANFNPTFTLYIDAYSRAGLPPVQTLHRSDGRLVQTLAANEALHEKIRMLHLTPPEFITVTGDDSVTLNAYLIKPPDFDPSQQYPLLMHVYGGPGSQTVRDSWGGSRYLWHQMFAQQGYIVASVDNRGTGARGRTFKKITYLNLGHYEAADQIAAARSLGQLPYVDAERMGIWGWSYGGYMAALSIFKGAAVFKTAVSVAPVTDWRLYDTIYTERYMRTPQENPDGYAASAPLAYADRLEGTLLLVHGTGDDNVHFQNTVQLVQALEAANKQFELRIYPNKRHAIAGPTTRVNLYTLITDFIRRTL